ncbi:outer membrane protein assembly factor BamD [Deltaproteobacteria bacterium TL4]
MKSLWYVIRSEVNLSLLVSMFSLLVFQGCAETDAEIRTPAKELYQKAFIAYEEDLLQESEDKFKKLTEEHPGTRLATLAYLKMGDINYQRAKWEDAETNYRLFLTINPNSHLTPYVLNRLIALNYKRNVTGLFFKERSFDRDMDPNNKIIEEYQRFYLMYSQNAYIEEVREYLLKARSDLAEHEYLVGNFYLKQRAYDSAIHRYLYLLRQYPEYPKRLEVGKSLIEAYYSNQQSHLAKEMEKVLEFQEVLGKINEKG